MHINDKNHYIRGLNPDKMTNTPKLLLYILTFLVLVCSCANEQKSPTSNQWKNSSWIQLEKENISLRLPNQFKRSSRYRLEEDLSLQSSDSISLKLTQKWLRILEFEDSEIDVYVDTSATYRFVMICNLTRIAYTPTDIGVLKKSIENDNKRLAALNPDLHYGEVEANMSRAGEKLLSRITTEVTNTQNNAKVFKSIYFLTTDYYTLVVYEFSENADVIEKYLYTSKLG